MATKKRVFIGIEDDNVLFRVSKFSEAETKAERLIKNCDAETVIIVSVDDAWVLEIPEPQTDVSKLKISDLIHDED